MSKTTWLGSAAVALVFGITAAVAQNAPGAAEKRGESSQAQAPAKSERSDGRQKERSAQDADSKVGAKEAREPRRDDKGGQQQAQERAQREESKQPARQSEQQDRNERSPASAQRQDTKQDSKQARQPSEKDAKQPEQKDAKQPADSRQQQTRDQQKQDSNRAAESKDDAQKPQQRSQQPAPANSPTNQASQPAPAAKGDTAQQSQPGTGSTTNQPGISMSTTTQISEQQRTQVRETLARDRTTLARENQNLNIQVNVGVALPANVRVRSLPPDIVRIAPQYRGYEYTVVEDEIVILEPRTRRVVEVLEEPGRARQSTSRVSATSRQVLTDEQRHTLRQSVQRTTTTGSTSSSVGLDASCLTLQNLPDEMARANPDLRNYRMLTIGQQLVLVDPQQQKVVEVID